jgi:hypothetical protein
MPRIETLLERPLRKPLDDATREAIDGAYRQRKHEIPIPTELRWHATSPQFTIKSPLMSFIVKFTPDRRLVVVAEFSFAGLMLASDANRKQAVKFIETIAGDLGLC